MRHRLFFDESGDRSPPRASDPKSCYLGLCGTVFSWEEYHSRFGPSVDNFRRRHFGPSDRDEPVILHREGIIGKRGPFVILEDGTKRATFDADLLKLLESSQYYVLTVVVDKRQLIARYGKGADPYARCVTELLERYSNFLRSTGGVGDVMGEARHQHLDQPIREAYSFYYEEKVQRKTAVPFTSKEIKLKPKEADIVGIQLADLLAHPATQDILLSEGLVEEIGPFTQQVCARIRGKYLPGNGRVFLTA